MKKVLLFTLLLAGLSFAGEQKEANEGMILFWKAVNTVILLGLVYYFGGKHIKKFLNGRRENVANMVLEAQKMREDSQKALEDAKRKLEEAKYKLEESIKISKETAEREREHAIMQANEIAERIKAQAKETINIEIRKAEAKLKKYAAEKALEVSKSLIESSINPQTSNELIKKTIKGLEA